MTKSLPVWLAVVSVLVLQGRFCSAATIDLSTPGNAANWLITAAGAVDAPSFQTDVNRPGSITLIDSTLIDGNFVDGASVGQYNGFWFAENRFEIPVGATDVQFTFENLWANDRVVMSLNGVNLGDATFGGGTGPGLMRFVENDPDQAFTFDGIDSGTVTTGFIIGGTNTLRLTVNNTGVNLAAPTVASAFPLDGTLVHLPTANVTFTTVPEPTGSLALAALATVVVSRRRRR